MASVWDNIRADSREVTGRVDTKSVTMEEGGEDSHKVTFAEVDGRHLKVQLPRSL
jgi:hypothetical protein